MAAQRVRYRRISNEDRGRLVDAFENNNLDYIELADTLGIKRATARYIVATYLREGRRDKILVREPGGVNLAGKETNFLVHGCKYRIVPH